MKHYLCAALAVICLFLCRSARATDVVFDVTSTDAGAYTSYCGQTCNVTLQNKTFSACSICEIIPILLLVMYYCRQYLSAYLYPSVFPLTPEALSQTVSGRSIPLYGFLLP